MNPVAGVIRLAHIVNLGRVYECFIGRANLPNVLVPDPPSDAILDRG